MSVLPIATVGNPGLRVRATVVTRDQLLSVEVQTFIDDLIETMRHANGAGLAATQVLRHQRICVVEVANNPRYPYKPPIPLTVLVNPVLTPIDDEVFRNYEGCLSVPGLRGEVDRSTRVHVRAWDRLGNEIDEEVRGLKAATYQHEVDHLDGLLFLDRVVDRRSLATWDSFNEFHKDAFVERVTALVAKHGS